MYQSLLSKIDLKNKKTASLLGGFLSSFLIFLLIYIIILPSGKGFESVKDSSVVDFVRLRKNDYLNERQRALPDKPPPPKRPPPPELETPDVKALPTPKLDIKFPDIKMPIDTNGAFVGGGKYMGDGGLIPLVRITPRYPRNALLNNVEGVVVIELLGDEGGSVVTAKVVEANPSGVFNAAAIQAVLKWKFKPRVLNGIAVQQRGLTTIEFII